MVLAVFFYDYDYVDKLWVVLRYEACYEKYIKCFKYEMGWLIWYLDSDRVIGLYSWHYTSVAWVASMLGWFMVLHICVYWVIGGYAWFSTKLCLFSCINDFYE